MISFPLPTSAIRLAFGCALAVASAAAGAQPFPVKPVRIVTQVPGGSLDLTARMIAPKLSERLGQPVIVDNRGGIISMELVARAPADGYTLLVASGSLWTNQFLREDTPWDALRDYAPVTPLVTSPNVLVVHPSLPVKSVKELVALAKARKGQLNYSSGQSGSSSHIAGELFKSMAGTDIVRVAYKGQGPAMIALVTGETQLSFPNAASATPFIKSGKIRAIAVTTAKPSALIPGLPTVAASGLPGYQSKAIVALFAPAKTPAPVLAQLNTEAVRTLEDPEVRQRLFESGAEAGGGTPAELTAEIKSEIAAMGKLMKGLRGGTQNKN
ncbi:MAG TPA: tripartite tricarboxylate transporter substrate binding protein [Burkholderiales bacterium]|nr:tripartite tricarboxylate transporter substrate binding protein [Burkholderiales bacterium]